MTVSVNGNPVEIEDGSTVAELLKRKGYVRNKSSVWMDGKQLLASEYDNGLIDGCSLKIVRILGGG